MCEKAQIIKTLPDLRIQAERERKPTEEECLITSLKYKQNIGPRWSEQFDDKGSKWFQPVEKGRIENTRYNRIEYVFGQANKYTHEMKNGGQKCHCIRCNMSEAVYNGYHKNYDDKQFQFFYNEFLNDLWPDAKLMFLEEVERRWAKKYHKFKYYDKFDENSKRIVRVELPRYMSEDEVREWIKIHEPMDEEY